MAEIDDDAAVPLTPDGLGMGLGLRKGDRAGGSDGSGGTAGTAVASAAIVTGRATRSQPAQFEHERLHVYQFAREFFIVAARWRSRQMPADLKKQFERSTGSILSNIAEGAGKTARADKRRFYEIAKGSTTEAGAQLDMLQILGVIDAAEYATARERLLKVAKMLSGLCGAPRTTGP